MAPRSNPERWAYSEAKSCVHPASGTGCKVHRECTNLLLRTPPLSGNLAIDDAQQQHAAASGARRLTSQTNLRWLNRTRSSTPNR